MRNWAWFYSIWFGWDRLSPWVIRKHGFLDAVKYRIGADNISAGTFRETQARVRAGDEWKHWKDGFDYRAAFAEMELPPCLYLAGKKDRVLGHPTDVKLLMQETGAHQPAKFHLLSKSNGHRNNYGHIDMLTHKDAPQDHFPMAVKWLRGDFS